MHISDQIRSALIADGWDDRDQDNGDTLFYRRQETGGAFGETITLLRMDRSGRWLERPNGWDEVERDIDLRDFSDPASAIAAILI